MPDGVVSPAVWVSLDVVSAGAVGYAAHKTQRKIEPRDVPLMGVMTAFIFAAQMVNFPVGGGVSGHVLGATLAAILLGIGPAILVMTTVLVIQMLLFADGGLTAIGVNICNMGLVAPLVGLGAYSLMTRGKKELGTHTIAAFVGAWASVVVAAALVLVELYVSGKVAPQLLPYGLGVHVLIGLGEGAITVAALRLIWQTRPDLIPFAQEATSA